MYRPQLRGQRGQRSDTRLRQEVSSSLLDLAFFFAREFDGFPLPFFPSRIQSNFKPKVASFCVVLFYEYILAVLLS